MEGGVGVSTADASLGRCSCEDKELDLYMLSC